MTDVLCPSPPCPDGPRREQARAGIATIDALLEVLEHRHLDGRDVTVGLLPEWGRDLEATGLVVPQAVLGATTTVVLHERLLDWQEQLLNAAYPRRAIETHSRRWRSVSRRSALRSARPAPVRLLTDPRAADSLPPSGEDHARPNLDGLTDREVAVLRVVAEGLTNAQVARRLHLSEHTVAAHLRSIFRKADVTTRSGATRYAIENGLT